MSSFYVSDELHHRAVPYFLPHDPVNRFVLPGVGFLFSPTSTSLSTSLERPYSKKTNETDLPIEERVKMVASRAFACSN